MREKVEWGPSESAYGGTSNQAGPVKGFEEIDKRMTGYLQTVCSDCFTSIFPPFEWKNPAGGTICAKCSERRQHAADMKEVEKRLYQPREVRVVDPSTGGEKGSKLARFDLIPPEALWGLAEVYGAGCKKYADRNWEKGYKWGLSVAALQRHLHLWLEGESYDEETGCHHLLQVAWHAFTLFTFEIRWLGTDDVRLKRDKVKL